MLTPRWTSKPQPWAATRAHPGGGGHSGTKWIFTGKLSNGAEMVHDKIQRRSAPLDSKEGGGQLQTKNLIGQ